MLKNGKKPKKQTECVRARHILEVLYTYDVLVLFAHLIYDLRKNIGDCMNTDDEKIIIKNALGWKGVVEPKRFTDVVLTNKHLHLMQLQTSIPLSQIERIDIESTATTDPHIKIIYNGNSVKLFFSRATSGSLFHLTLGSGDKVSREWVSYTMYWASLITMAKYLFGEPELYLTP